MTNRANPTRPGKGTRTIRLAHSQHVASPFPHTARAHRLPQDTLANCNGDDARGCSFSLGGYDMAHVKEAARQHAREQRHETVVTLVTLVVYDGRPR